MTVQRSNSEVLKFPAELVAESMRAILKKGQVGYQYRDSKFSDCGMLVSTVIRPNWWPLVMSTRMIIQIDPHAESLTVVTARTKSQGFVMGDAFNQYNGYLIDLLRSLRVKCTLRYGKSGREAA